MPRPVFRAVAFALLLAASATVAAATLAGTPLLRHYTVEDTHATPVHHALATGGDGALYVGNAEGVLHFDGVDWQHVALPGQVAAIALATGHDGLVYVGGQDTFGRIVRDGDGNAGYEELMTRAGLRGAQRHVGLVWDVMPTSDGVYFRAEHHLFFLPDDGGPAGRWALPEEVRAFHYAGGVLYARLAGRGLCRVEDGRFVDVPGGAVFADQILAGVFERGGHGLLIGGRGLYRADNDGIERVPGPVSDWLDGRKNYASRELGDGSIAVGTLDGDLMRFDATLAVREQIDLGPFAVHDLDVDREGGLWVATEGDLVRLAMPSPWSFLGATQGLAGSPADFAWHDGALWLATSRGIARMATGAEGRGQAEYLPWTGLEGHALLSTDAGLLAGVREGLLVLDPGATTPRTLMRNEQDGVLSLLPSTDGTRVYAVTSLSMLLLHRVDSRWQVQATLPLQGVNVSSMVETAPGELWLGDTRGPPQRWRIDAAGAVTTRQPFADADGLAVDTLAGTRVYLLDDRLHAVSGTRGFRLDGERFVPDASPPVTLVERPSQLSVVETPLGDYAHTTRELWRRATDGGEWQPVYPGLPGAAGYLRLGVGDDGVLRVATWEGLLQFDPAQAPPPPHPLKLDMQSVSARGPSGDVLRLPPRSDAAPVRVPAGHSLNLRFAMISMESGAEFRYLLHGVTPEWSAWTDRDLFIRVLPAGDYVLQVQARTRNGRQAADMHYRFQVQRRWYEQWWVVALGLAALVAVGVLGTLWLVRQRTERYLAANRRLEARIAERTRELEDLNRQLAELVTEDALTGVANRRALETGLRREWFRGIDQRRPLGMLMIDVDHFKAYNDEHGHLEGDAQLRGIAQRLQKLHDPQRELLARYGGEEFALLLPGVHPDEALRRAEALRADIAGSGIGMTVSIGVASFVPSVQVEPDSLLRRADAALYAAKRGGRNRVEADAGG